MFELIQETCIKSATEPYKADVTIATAYDYTPYGTVTATGIDQPIQWSSEHYDPELALVYYNYRHYNPADGRWINRDPIAEEGGRNLYAFVENSIYAFLDVLGLELIHIPNTDATLDMSRINCIGYSTGLNGDLQLGASSFDELFTALGWSCTNMKNSGECHCDCDTEEAMAVYVHIRARENENGELIDSRRLRAVVDDLMKRAYIDDLWTARNIWKIRTIDEIDLIDLLDVHGVRRNCLEADGSPKAWDYVPESGVKGTESVKIRYVSDPNVTSPDIYNYIRKCCKKKKQK